MYLFSPYFPKNHLIPCPEIKLPTIIKKQRNVKVGLECKYLKLLDAIQY